MKSQKTKNSGGKRKLRKRIMMISTHGYVGAEPPLGAPDTGGQVVFVLELSKKFAQFGYEVDIWTRKFEDQPEIDEVEDNVRVIRMPCGGNDFIPKEYLCRSIPEWVRNAFHYIKKKNINYEFIDSHYWDAGLAGHQLSRLLDIPHIHTPHSIGSWKKSKMEEDFLGDDDKFEKKYNFNERIRQERSLYHSCDTVIATTPIQLDMIAKDYDLPRSKIRMIPPGYDDSRFFPIGISSEQIARERLGYEGRIIFAVARLARNKGFDLLVDAFSMVAEREPETKLILAVGHEERDEVEEEIYQELVSLRKKYQLEDRIKFTGFIEDELLPDYYRAADVFVLSSRYEPFGMTAVEAMACGTPVVATTHGGLYRVFNYGEQVVFADPFDKEDLAITIIKVLRYRALRNRLKDHGARAARELFTWTSIAQQTLNAAEKHLGSSLLLQVRPLEEA